MKTKLLSIALLACTFTACKKDDKNTTCPNTMAAIAGTYVPTKFEFGINGLYQPVSLDPCQNDDKLVLSANGTANYQDAGTACNPNGDESGSWNIDSNGKVSIAAGSLDLTNADIVSFDCSKLVIVATSGGTASLRVTLVK